MMSEVRSREYKEVEERAWIQLRTSNLVLRTFQIGFTLIELLVVVGILSILALIVFVALDPSRRFADSRNSRRWRAAHNILTAAHECIVDNAGATVPCIGPLTAGETYEIVSNATSGCDDVCTASSDTHCADLDTRLAAYLKELPKDPGRAAGGHTEYSISVDANGIVSIRACSAEGGMNIRMHR